jgi:outer membrane protein OmpA-like peptidoglycan-associated protein
MNSAFTDFGTSFYGRYIVFSSSNAKGAKAKNIHQWNKESYLDFYIAFYDEYTGALSEVQKWNDTFNSEFHESTPIFTNDKQTVYFTRNDVEGGDFEKINNHSIRTDKLKIYRSYLDIQGNWSTPEELPFNNSEYSVAHPALSADGTKLYFSSDMPGGRGESDLYEVAIHSDGSFGVPINLGNKINTEGKETFPFISASNDLYFSSDGHPGLGGLDIFVIHLDAEPTSDNLIYNVGKPVNSPADDFALIIDEKTKRGYFSSNRTEGKGKDDIYSFIQLNPLKIGDDLAKILALNPIYFDLDKSFIRPDAAVELDKVVKIMKEFPNMEIDVRSHTDSRATFNYNIKLSERRAKSTVQYLVDNGILRSRMTSKGYGETVLLNKCKDNVYCSEAAHQLNRRSEFIITKQ